MKSIQSCINYLNQRKFNIMIFHELIKEKENLEDNTQSVHYKQLRKQLNDLNLSNWQVQYGHKVKDLVDLLTNENLKNLVIINHSHINGVMEDSLKVKYPKSIFNLITPNLLSLSIFSCNTEAVKKYYNIKEIFEKRQSAYGSRFYFRPELKKIWGFRNFTPINELSYFMRFIKRKLNHLNLRFKNQTKYILKDNMKCRLVLPFENRINIDENPYGLFLNRQLIGIERTEGDYIYPCYFEIQNNTLLFTPLKFSDNIIIHKNPSLNIPNKEIKSSKHLYTDEQSYSHTKWTF